MKEKFNGSSFQTADKLVLSAVFLVLMVGLFRCILMCVNTEMEFQSL